MNQFLMYLWLLRIFRSYIKKRPVNVELEKRSIQYIINKMIDGKYTKRAAEDNDVKLTTSFYRIKKFKKTEGEKISQKTLKFNSKYTVN